ncbi:hypothetical protein TUBRATIS_15370 [Tubulinosema ratisbonensis]|uniref:Uncharacterized protein n=1 Tax=Tubulinosema ratisbonensis TaxID=291195 RepID=A0A437AL89_9MICR|nr:hypothetical protein TUBRATIS_15370 [Tubulinosema ratisbonensis]
MFMFLPFFFKNVILSEKKPSVFYKEKVTQFEKMLNLLKEGDLVECVLFASENFDYNAEEKLEKAECKCQALFELRKEINLQIQGLLNEMAKESPLSKTEDESSHKEIRQLSDKLMKKYLKSLQISRQNQLCGKENQHTRKQSTIKFVNLSLQNDGKEKNKKEFLGVGSLKMTFNPFEKYKQFEKEKRKESEEKKRRERLPYARTHKKKEESSITFDSSDEEREERIKKLEEKRQKLLQEIKIEMAARGITEEKKYK